MRVVFFGTPEIAATVLSDCIKSKNIEIIATITSPPRPIGRGQKIAQSPVHNLAAHNNIPVYTPASLRQSTELFNEITALEPDYFLVIAYGKILPQNWLNIPKNKCINIHGSLLPKYRGASPLQSAILNGEIETGISIMEMSAEMDAGPVAATFPIVITPNMTTQDLFHSFSQYCGSQAIEVLVQDFMGAAVFTEQNHEKASYCSKIEKSDGFFLQEASPQQNFNRFRAFFPWPGIRITHKNISFRVLSCRPVISDKKFPDIFPGEITFFDKNTIGYVCSGGYIQLETILLDGKKPARALDILRNFISYVEHRI